MPRGVCRRQCDIQRAGGIVRPEGTASVLNGLLPMLAHGVHIAAQDGLVRAGMCAVHIDVDLARLLSDDAVVLRFVRILRSRECTAADADRTARLVTCGTGDLDDTALDVLDVGSTCHCDCRLAVQRVEGR